MNVLEQLAMRVLFVDDDAMLRTANVESLELAGFDAVPFADAQSVLPEITRELAGVVISDIRMPRIDGLQLLAKVREIDVEIPVILITGHADVPMAIGALRDGAFDFITKPFAADYLVAAVTRAMETRRLVLENRRLREAAIVAEETYPLIGETPAMQRLRETIAQLAQADLDVLIEGETGTGKELVAVLLHRWGPRRGEPFVSVNCGALPAAGAELDLFGQEAEATPQQRGRIGKVESADKGTLFLDEIDSMEPAVQVKMLRVLEQREVTPVGGIHPRAVNMRVVAASKQELTTAVANGEFRADLLYRLNVVQLRIPPLRERRADIPQLFAHFLDVAAKQLGRKPRSLTNEARRQLLEHDWPGNVRELRNFAYRFALNFPDATGAEFDADALTLPKRMDQFEAAILREALTAAGGNIRDVLVALGIPRKTLYDKLARHSISPAEFRHKRGA